MLKYIKIWFYFLKEIFYYSYLLILDNIHLLFLIFVLTSLGIFGAKSTGIEHIWGIAIGVYAWYIFITELVMVNRKDQNMINEIKSWSIITFLNKPISFVGFYFSQTYFKTLLNILIIGGFCGIIIFSVLWVFPRFGIGPFLLFVFSFLVGIVLLALVSLMIALFAFILEDSTFVRLLINKLYFVFWWLFFPITIYPEWMQTIAAWLPFKYYLYAPARFFTTGDIEFFISYFPIQLLRCAILTWCVLLIYRKAVRNLEVNGG